MNQEKIGIFIKEQRIKNKLTQEQLAVKLGVTYQAVSKWENGKNIPDIGTLKLICELFNVNINEVLNGEKKKKSKGYLLIIILVIFFVCLGIFLFSLNKNNNFEFTSLKASCEEFKLSGSAAYNKDKTAIYISGVSYCGKENNIIYDVLECNLYENYNEVITKMSSCNKVENMTLEKYLESIEMKIDNYNSMCKKFNESNIYLEINATKDSQTVMFKIPITLNEEC